MTEETEFDSYQEQASKSALGPTRHPTQWVPGAASPKAKRREADLASSIVVKNDGAVPPLPIDPRSVVLN
jgi:hypothetical protein